MSNHGREAVVLTPQQQKLLDKMMDNEEAV